MYIHESGKPQLTLTFDGIGQIAGVLPGHSFLKYKKNAILIKVAKALGIQLF